MIARDKKIRIRRRIGVCSGECAARRPMFSKRESFRMSDPFKGDDNLSRSLMAGVHVPASLPPDHEVGGRASRQAVGAMQLAESRTAVARLRLGWMQSMLWTWTGMIVTLIVLSLSYTVLIVAGIVSSNPQAHTAWARPPTGTGTGTGTGTAHCAAIPELLCARPPPPSYPSARPRARAQGHMAAGMRMAAMSVLGYLRHARFVFWFALSFAAVSNRVGPRRPLTVALAARAADRRGVVHPACSVSAARLGGGAPHRYNYAT